jgi:hypothetical protein
MRGREIIEIAKLFFCGFLTFCSAGVNYTRLSRKWSDTGMKDLSAVSNVLLSVCLVFSLSVAGCSREPQKTEAPHKAEVSPPPVASGGTEERQAPQPLGGEVATTTAVLATIGAGEKVVVTGQHGTATGFSGIIFGGQGRGVAYTEEKDNLYRVVYNGRPGKSYKTIEGLALSPDGNRTAYAAQVGDKWCVVVDGREGSLFDAVGYPKFSPDSRHIVYNATMNGKGHFVVDDTVSKAFPSSWDERFTGDSKRVILIENSETDDSLHRVVISDLALRKQRVKELRAILFVYNRDNSRIAAIAEKDGKKRIIDLSIDRLDAVNEGPLYNEVGYHTFGADGVSLAYVAERDGKLYLVLNGKEELLPDSGMPGQPSVRPDGKGAGIILTVKEGSFFHQGFIGDHAKRKKYQGAGQPVYGSDNRRYAYIAQQGKRFFAVVNDKEGPAFDIIVTPMFSPDGKVLVYRARKDGKRFVVVSDLEGKVLRQYPPYEEVYDTVFTADGKAVAYGVKDGQKLIWKVEKLP